MKKILFGILNIALIMLFASISRAGTPPSKEALTIVNHFDTALQFTVGTNPQTLPGLPTTFSLAQNQDIITAVLKGKEAYIKAEGQDRKHAFFGVNIENEKVRVHGYLSHGIAYSWTTNVVTFCTPDEYKEKHTCNRK